MSNPLDREALEEQMTRYVLGELRGEEAKAFRCLLAERPELALEARRLRGALALMPYGATTEPPPHLRSRVLATVRPQHLPRRLLRALPWSRIAVAAAALVAAAFLSDNVRLRRELGLERDASLLLQQPNVVLSFSLRGTGTGARAFGRVVLDLDAKKGAVVIRELPALSGERVYRLWAEVGPEKVFCGQFNASAEETVMSLFPIPVDAYTEPVSKLVLTVEPAAAPVRPTGPTVMVGSLG